MNSREVLMRPGKAAVLGMFLFLLAWFATGRAQEKRYSLTVLWAPNTEEDLAGYRVYFGTDSRKYTSVVDVGNRTSCTVGELQGGIRYYFAVTAYDYSGNESDFSEEVSAIPDDPKSFLPAVYILYQNYPNPFYPQTTIPFYLPDRAFVFLEIVNLEGQIVRTLRSGWLHSGNHTAVWDGRDAYGHEVASGVYFVRFRAGKFQLAHPVLLAR